MSARLREGQLCYGLAISARYTVMSGTPEKILELLLEAMRPDSSAHDPTGRGRRHFACSDSLA